MKETKKETKKTEEIGKTNGAILFIENDKSSSNDHESSRISAEDRTQSDCREA